MAKRTPAIRTPGEPAMAELESRKIVVNGRTLGTVELNEGVIRQEIVSASLNIPGAVSIEADGGSYILVSTIEVAMGNGTRPRGFDFCRITPEPGVSIKEIMDALSIHRHAALRKSG